MNAVARLRGARDAAHALRLAGLALKKDPPLPDRDREELRHVEAQLRSAPTAPAAP